MIKGFEKETAELSDYENRVLLPALYHGMITKLGKENAISSTEAIKALKHHGSKRESIIPATNRHHGDRSYPALFKEGTFVFLSMVVFYFDISMLMFNLHL